MHMAVLVVRGGCTDRQASSRNHPAALLLLNAIHARAIDGGITKISNGDAAGRKSKAGLGRRGFNGRKPGSVKRLDPDLDGKGPGVPADLQRPPSKHPHWLAHLTNALADKSIKKCGIEVPERPWHMGKDQSGSVADPKMHAGSTRGISPAFPDVPPRLLLEFAADKGARQTAAGMKDGTQDDSTFDSPTERDGEHVKRQE
ncbi:hypothetical protein QBC47DRAFT_463371 [Echria macrotheca]|uniref:Uncharacterized protein n=1 Tax=Echria macrotheca TaxID=438768 RepID=A0AAJ0F398_9PEZI|nr:hypothetical protein QBC47DRAFT_463371 [Echria macrotheca]